jgi:hypothetical protein
MWKAFLRISWAFRTLSKSGPTVDRFNEMQKGLTTLIYRNTIKIPMPKRKVQACIGVLLTNPTELFPTGVFGWQLAGFHPKTPISFRSVAYW